MSAENGGNSVSRLWRQQISIRPIFRPEGVTFGFRSDERKQRMYESRTPVQVDERIARELTQNSITVVYEAPAAAD